MPLRFEQYSALCNFPSLLTNRILRLEQMEDTSSLEDFSADERREHRVFEHLLESYPGLLERLQNGSEEELIHVGELIGKGAAGARGDDTKTLNGEISVCGDQWPVFLYANYTYDADDPWCGLLRNRLLVSAYKHVFTSPSSVDKEPKATRSGNTRLHGMNAVMIASIAYIATQVRFSLSSSSVFSRTDTTTDSETFYHSLLDLLEDPDEYKEIDELLTWWNRYILYKKKTLSKDISDDQDRPKL
ncbi:uncharacterized protein F5891DRAFT_1209452 [Suillus fuscotomentosus]|uniref:Uncharacterized protein n=1 Tax=Suillus fuscotomentosus TaxID=1912939 RepID=A0AAD4HCW3_9AGAM|nr:uncharacterized protein F5891DRAFT_1209452 [Suillus fuscotomentosus]KAG1892965.1 hypothetical protein F5891DRAFT_1209452 [Suillus fuscotomentosus]